MSSQLKSIIAAIDVTTFVDMRDIVSAWYTAAKAHMKDWSWFTMSDQMGLGHNNTAHLISQGKRSVSVKLAQKICLALDLAGQPKKYLITLAAWQHSKDPGERERLFHNLYTLRERATITPMREDMFAFYETWYHPAIRELVALDDFQSDPTWIANRLQPKIRIDEARKSLALLERLGMIAMDPTKNRHVITESRVSTGAEVDSHSVIRYHQSMLELAKASITDIDEKMRDISAITFNGNMTMIALVKAEIEAMRLRLLSISERTNSGPYVLQLNMQLFPLTSGAPVAPLRRGRKKKATEEAP